ncbi:hypothetical protein [Flavivirga eckloniae]|uniref:Uncharacterized protein n=1 Tax=Flavivirga eckloniae TaxID=1803846 RepID=A0A2K9PQH4_9FLAO|nr:hypothetical protein [Flavivirga eckloniae]AUP79311.1 hypothetical protein C1H87_11580 [Flavivirga eckloniae]
MKKILSILLLTVVFACNSGNKSKDETQKDNVPSAETEMRAETKTDTKAETKTETKTEAKTETKIETKSNVNSNSNIVSEFLADIKTLEDVKGQNPISSFQKLAEEKASKVLTVSKDNIKEVLASAKEYSNCVITTGDHTIVKISDITDCKPSGSWGACMPFAKGYIKKGELILQEDYINNIIGIPDSQDRKAYLFN